MQPLVIEKIGQFLVLRDDLIYGGTKVRVIGPVLDNLLKKRKPCLSFTPYSREVVYASPVTGHAQLALAVIGREKSLPVTIVTAQRRERYVLTKEVVRLGAQVLEERNARQSNLAAKARVYCNQTGALLLPFGLDCSEMLEGIASLARSLGINPPEVWSVAGSGTLTRGLQRAWPEAEFHAVRVGCRTSDIGRAVEHIAPEDYSKPAIIAPPFPSCITYDAKAWRFFKEHAKAGALFWNVAADPVEE